MKTQSVKHQSGWPWTIVLASVVVRLVVVTIVVVLVVVVVVVVLVVVTVVVVGAVSSCRHTHKQANRTKDPPFQY